jgi:hypothetical protein
MIIRLIPKPAVWHFKKTLFFPTSPTLVAGMPPVIQNLIYLINKVVDRIRGFAMATKV